jgi:hypothetical protein
MKRITLTLLVLTALVAGYVIGVVRATQKAIREDRLGPALFAIAVAKAVEAKDQTKAEKVDRLRLKRAIEEAAALGEIKWPRVILESTYDIEGHAQLMAVIAEYVEQHPELEISSAARADVSKFRKKEPNQLPEPTSGLRPAAAE